jgi:hypothetical protein
MKINIHRTDRTAFIRENLVDIVLGLFAFLVGAVFFIYIAQIPY